MVQRPIFAFSKNRHILEELQGAEHRGLLPVGQNLFAGSTLPRLSGVNVGQFRDAVTGAGLTCGMMAM